MEKSYGEHNVVRYTTLHIDNRLIPSYASVVAVAVEGAVNDWAAYIGVIPVYEDKQTGIQSVAAHGTKLQYEVAKSMFPDVDARLTWRP